MEQSTEFLKKTDREYQEISGLTERRFYSIFHSQIHPYPVLILGYNIGGKPNKWNESELASQSFYENREHEYVDRCYPIANAMRIFLQTASDIKKEGVRRIPKTNLIFQSSGSQDTLKMKPYDALEEAKLILKHIIERVGLDAIICEGMCTWEKFERHYCRKSNQKFKGKVVVTPNGCRNARIYRVNKAFMPLMNWSVKLLGIRHPSRYYRRQKWKEILRSSRSFLAIHTV